MNGCMSGFKNDNQSSTIPSLTVIREKNPASPSVSMADRISPIYKSE